MIFKSLRTICKYHERMNAEYSFKISLKLAVNFENNKINLGEVNTQMYCSMNSLKL